MKEQFVDYETAKILKELGYTECTNNYYSANGGNMENQVLYIAADGFADNSNRYRTVAPLWQEVENWLWKNHNIYIKTEYSISIKAFLCKAIVRQEGKIVDIESDSPIAVKIECIKAAVKHLHSQLSKQK